MAFTDMDEVEQELDEDEGTTTPSGPGNRNFWIIFGILGGIIVLALVCLAVIAVINRSGRQNDIAERAAQATEISFGLTQTASVPRVTPTTMPPTRTPPPAPTNTPLMPLNPTVTATSVDAAIATRSALMTLAAEATAATALPTSTLLPGTGFADDVGIPGLLAMAAVFVVVIFLVRRLRFAGTKAP